MRSKARILIAILVIGCFVQFAWKVAQSQSPQGSTSTASFEDTLAWVKVHRDGLSEKKVLLAADKDIFAIFISRYQNEGPYDVALLKNITSIRMSESDDQFEINHLYGKNGGSAGIEIGRHFKSPVIHVSAVFVSCPTPTYPTDCVTSNTREVWLKYPEGTQAQEANRLAKALSHLAELKGARLLNEDLF